MKYNRTAFFDGTRAFLTGVGKNLNQPRVTALNFLLDMFEKVPAWNDVRLTAYALATIFVETAYTFEPIQEFGSYEYFERRYGSLTRKGRELGNDAPGEGAKYSGKGYVQLTGETNYEKLELKIRSRFPQLVNDWQRKTGKEFDLTDYAEQAKNPTFAFLIMTVGMFEGLFTGKKLSDYINGQITDYVGARRIINGQDRAVEIAGYARTFEKILKNSAASLIPETRTDTTSPPPDNLTGAPETVALSEQPESATNQAAIQAPAPETTETTTVEKTDSTTTQITSAKNEQPVDVPAEVTEPAPYNGIGFWATIKADLAKVVGTNVTLQTLSEYGQQANNIPLWLVPILTKLALIALVAGIGYLVFRVIHYLVDTHKKNQRTRLEAEAKTAIDRRDIQWK